MIINNELIEEYTSAGLITCKSKWKLRILNYTDKCQWEKKWDTITINSRGTIIDESGKILYRWFKKFFNYGESNAPELKNIKTITEKFDGSLGILYFQDGKPAIATRGSFDSPQAIKATSILLNKYPQYVEKCSKNLSRLFEIIYKDNKIVVDYWSEERLVFLSVIDTEGRDINTDTSFIDDRVEPKILTLEEAILHKKENFEWYVILDSIGNRVKIKNINYILRHKAKAWLSEKVIKESTLYSLGIKKFIISHELIQALPDEMYDETQQKIKEYTDYILSEEERYNQIFSTLVGERKEKAKAINAFDVKDKSILFMLLSGQDIKEKILIL